MSSINRRRRSKRRSQEETKACAKAVNGKEQGMGGWGIESWKTVGAGWSAR